MNTTSLNTPAVVAGESVRRDFNRASLDRDIAEIAIGFGKRFGTPAGPQDGPQHFDAATLGGITFRRVDSLREPFEVADRRLNSHLETLCEVLRAKY